MNRWHRVSFGCCSWRRKGNDKKGNDEKGNDEKNKDETAITEKWTQVDYSLATVGFGVLTNQVFKRAAG